MYMKKIFLSVATAALFVTGNTFSQNPPSAKLVEKVVKKGNELVIPFEKYILPNGLTLIVHEDHSDPIVHLDVTYHVGSNREQVGRSGFAHFFEHMMFQGSDHVGDDQHFKIVTEAGGTMNGTTNLDRTNYFETLPSNQLEVALWLEADRMGFLLDAVTQPKFEIQRSTVKNERGQNYDNKPYGVVNEKVGEAMYPIGHPYSWTTIGYIEDLNRVDVNDLKKFFMRWYGPNNAVVTVAGDVSTVEVVRYVEKYFGSIQKCPEVKNISKQLVKLDKDRYISYEDKVRFPMFYMAYPSVNSFHPDEAPLDILADIMGGNKNSIFYQKFVKDQLAVQAGVQNPCSEVAGQFIISILPYPGISLAKIDSIVRATLVEFEKKGITNEDLKKFKASYEASLIGGLSSVSGKATQLASYQTFTGNANFIQKDLERYMKVTKEDVMRVFKQYIKDKPAVVLSVYPKGKAELIAKPDNYTIPKRDVENVKESDEYKNLVYVKAVDGFDRNKKPSTGANPIVKVPDYWTENFTNGLKAIGTLNNEVPVVTLQLSIESGHRFEPKEKAGIAALTANLMNEATTKHTAEQISQELDKLGSNIGVSAGVNEITMTVYTLKKNLDATLKLTEEILLMPKFDNEDFERSKKEQLEGIANQATQATAIASNVNAKLLYGEGNILAVPTIGISPTVSSITLDDVKNYYKNNINPTISEVVIVGDITKDEILPKLTFLKDWMGEKITRAANNNTPAIGKSKIYLVNKEKAPQSEIRIAYMAIPYDPSGDYYKVQIMNYTLGGAFNSRINMNLREAKGWTYGARSGFNGNKYAGPFAATAGVRGNASDSSIAEFMKEIKNFADNGITQKELDFTKMSIGQSDALKYETGSQKASFLKKLLDYNLDKTYIDKQNDVLKNITKQEVDAIAKKYLPYNNMNIVIVGDKESILPGLSKLGYEIIELDMDGLPLKKSDTPAIQAPQNKEISPKGK